MKWDHLVLAVEEPGRAVAAIEAGDRADPEARSFRTDWVRRLLGDDLDAYASPRDRAAATLAHWTRIVAEQSPDFIWRGDDAAFHARRLRAPEAIPCTAGRRFSRAVSEPRYFSGWS